MTEANSKIYTCKHCGQEFDNSIKLARHIQAEHRGELQAEKEAEKLAGRLGGLTPDELSEKTLEFAEALEAAAPDLNAKTRKQMLLAYDDDSDTLSRDARACEDFLDDYGLRRKQQRQIIRQLFGSRRPEQAGLEALGLKTAQTPFGTMLILDRDARSQAPLFFGGGGGGESPETARAQAKLEARMERLEEALTGIAEAMKNREPPAPPMRRGRRVVFDKDGNIATDSQGNIIYEPYEEPWEPGARDTTTETLLPLLVNRAFAERKEPKEIDEEALALKIKERIAPKGEGDAKSVAAEVKDSLRSELSEVRKEIESMKTEHQTQQAIEAATRPLQAQLDAMTAQLAERGGYKGLSDSQAQLRFQKELVDTVVSAVGDQLTGVKEELRPFVLQQAVQSLRNQGLGDEVIRQFLSAVRERVPAGTIPETAKEEALRRIKEWSKG